MKKLFSIIAVWLYVCSSAAQAVTFEDRGLFFSVNADDPSTVTLVGPFDNKKDSYLAGVSEVIVPSTAYDRNSEREYTVVNVDYTAFEGVLSVKRIEVPSTVTGPLSIIDVPNLETLILHEGLVEIGCISDLPALRRLELPESLTTLGMGCFCNIGVENLRIPSGVKTLDYGSLCDCENLSHLEIPGIENVDMYCLSVLPNLKTIVFPPCFRGTQFITANSDFEEIWFDSDGSEKYWYLSMVSLCCKPKAVYSKRPNPPDLGNVDYFEDFNRQGKTEDMMFHGYSNMPNIILYVPAQSVEAYKNCPYWGAMDVRAYDFDASISELPGIGSCTDDTLYDLYGRAVTTDAPVPGIYVRSGHKIMIP